MNLPSPLTGFRAHSSRVCTASHEGSSDDVTYTDVSAFLSSEAFPALALTKAWRVRVHVRSIRPYSARTGSWSCGGGEMIRPPYPMGVFEFVAIAALRAAQLARGCSPRVDGDHCTAVLAQREVAEGKVIGFVKVAAEPPAAGVTSTSEPVEEALTIG